MVPQAFHRDSCKSLNPVAATLGFLRVGVRKLSFMGAVLQKEAEWIPSVEGRNGMGRGLGTTDLQTHLLRSQSWLC